MQEEERSVVGLIDSNEPIYSPCPEHRSRQNIMAWYHVPFAYIKGWTFCVMPGLYSSLHVHRPAQMLTGPTKLCLGR